MRKRYVQQMFTICLLFNCSEKITSQINFLSEYTDSTKNQIQLKLINNSNDTIFYYIGVYGVSDQGIKSPIASDIKSLGQEGFLSLMSLGPKQEFVQVLPRSKILKQSSDQSIKKIRFYVTYFKEGDFSAKGKTIRGKIL